MGLLRRILGGGIDNPDPSDAPVLGRYREERPCDHVYAAPHDAQALCDACGWRIEAHQRTDELGDLVPRHAPQNSTGEVILASEPQQHTATELIKAAGNSMPALAVAMTTIAQRFEDSVRNADSLNRALGEFREKAVVPLLEELKYLRYNLGDRVNKTTGNMEVMVDQLDKTIWGALRASGLTDDQIRTYRTEHGMNPEAPSGQELEIHMGQHQGLLDQVATLTAQNQRLLAQLGATHVFREAEAGEWVYHPGCECQACTAQTVQLAAMQAETSMANRVKTAPKGNDRRKRRG